MYGYSINDLLPPTEAAPTPAHAEILPPVAPSYAEPAPAEMTQEVVQQVGNLPPALQQHLAPLVIQHSTNPSYLAALMAQAVDAQARIERGEDPAVSPELAQFKQAAQAIEQEKRDQTVEMAQMFAGPVAALTAAAGTTPNDRQPASQVAFSNAGGNLGTSIGAFLEHIEQAGPTRVPDVRQMGGPAQGFART